MKTTQQAYPYPVINDEPYEDGDYLETAFQCGLEISLVAAEADDKANALSIDYTFMLSNEEIQKLIFDGDAAFALHVNCSDTLVRKMHFINPLSTATVPNGAGEAGDVSLRPEDLAFLRGKLEIPADELYGKVEFDPLIVMKSAFDGFTSSDLNEEFGDTKFNLRPGDIIGMSENVTKYVDYNRLEFTSLVRVHRSEDIDDYEYQIELTGSVILVYMGHKLHKVHETLKIDANTKPLLAMSIYKDCLLIALERLARDPENDSEPWARSLYGFLTSNGITLRDDMELFELNSIAQKLLISIGGGVPNIYKKLNTAEGLN